MTRFSLVLALWIFSPAVAWAAADHGTAQTMSDADGNIISVSAEASTATPYQNQPIRYTVRCVIRGNIFDVSLGDIGVGNAIVQPPRKPEVHDQVENGVVAKVAEFHFIITPLQPGKLTIPSVTLQGKFEAPDLAAAVNPLGERLSSGVRQALDFFNAHGAEPFSVASNATQLNVKPPAAAMDPWLPLTSLKIIEDSDASRPMHVGEPMTRKIMLLADGAVGSQLPDLERQQDRRDFKVYADKPTMGEDIDQKNGAILGWRKESYSLIAQKAGRLVLPAIRVSWWDIVNRKPATAELAERVVDVLPAAAAQVPSAAGLDGIRQGTVTARSEPASSPRAPTLLANAGSHLLLYGLMAVLAAVLAFAAIWRWTSRRRIARLVADDAPAAGTAKPVLEKPGSRPLGKRALDHVRTAEELRDFLQTYAQERRDLPKSASLERIFSALRKSWTGREKDDVAAIVKGLDAALYAGRPVDIADLKIRCRRFIASLKSESHHRRKRREMLPRLNPS